MIFREFPEWKSHRTLRWLSRWYRKWWEMQQVQWNSGWQEKCYRERTERTKSTIHSSQLISRESEICILNIITCDSIWSTGEDLPPSERFQWSEWTESECSPHHRTKWWMWNRMAATIRIRAVWAREYSKWQIRRRLKLLKLPNRCKGSTRKVDIQNMAIDKCLITGCIQWIQTLRLNRSTIFKNTKFVNNVATEIRSDEFFSDNVEPVMLNTVVT